MCAYACLCSWLGENIIRWLWTKVTHCCKFPPFKESSLNQLMCPTTVIFFLSQERKSAEYATMMTRSHSAYISIVVFRKFHPWDFLKKFPLTMLKDLGYLKCIRSVRKETIVIIWHCEEFCMKSVDVQERPKVHIQDPSLMFGVSRKWAVQRDQGAAVVPHLPTTKHPKWSVTVKTHQG